MINFYNFRFKLLLVTVISCLIIQGSYWANAESEIYSVVEDITQSPKYASLMINTSTGEIIHEHNADNILHPASLTKMMTAYLCFQAIKAKKLSLNTMLPVSHWAASQAPSKLWLKAGQKISVRDALHAIIIRSANDAATVIAEAIGGNEQSFAQKMTKVAHQLGMSNTYFKNANGLHHIEQVTTATDMAKLGIALRRDFPQFYHLFSKKSFVFKNAVINGHNRVLTRYNAADGLKTGYTNASGFNLVTSASKPEGRIVAVVLGGPTAAARDNHMINLLDKGFSSLLVSNKRKRQSSHHQDGVDENGGSSERQVFSMADSGSKPFDVASNNNHGSDSFTPETARILPVASSSGKGSNKSKALASKASLKRSTSSKSNANLHRARHKNSVASNVKSKSSSGVSANKVAKSTKKSSPLKPSKYAKNNAFDAKKGSIGTLKVQRVKFSQ